MTRTIKGLMLLSALALSGCVRIPEGVTAVDGVDVNRYLGTWYEIARMDHSFERGLTRVTAAYEPRKDGGIRVLNRGFDEKSGEWKEAEGKAFFVGGPGVGRLKVSFFGPFYGGYNIIALDKENYAYSMVCGPDRTYLWILARTTSLDDVTLSKLVKQAMMLGFETDKLIYVDHGTSPPEGGQ